MKEKNPSRGPISYLSCPAATQSFSKTAVFFNSMDCTYDYDFTDYDNLHMQAKEKSFLNFAVRRPPTLIDKPTVELQLHYIFFSEEPLNMDITPPMFHRPRYTNYATPVPGSFDIGRWFRSFILEIQLWEAKGKLILEAGEPLFYASFSTDKKVKLQRFVYTEVLAQHANACVNFFKNEPSLEKRYDLFENTSMREQVLKEIKDNLVL